METLPTPKRPAAKDALAVPLASAATMLEDFPPPVAEKVTDPVGTGTPATAATLAVTVND